MAGHVSRAGEQGVIDKLAAALADRYRVERELGAGGMATVYLAHDIKHERDVAIKVLHPDLGAALGGERFLTEIKTTAKLQHPHILPLLDSGNADGLLYYVMPLVTGETLRVRLERERQLPIADAVAIARGVASALDYAHRQNVIHRDIKPENILLNDGQPIVADFGIALAVQQASGARMTQTGLSLGTPQYMSPEQAMGERTIDARSDVYALGAVLYEMLAGDAPFTGGSVQAIVAKVLSERPTALRTLRDTVPVQLEEAVFTALAKLPADRPASAAEFSAMLGASGARTSAVPVSTQPMQRPMSRALPWLAGIGAGVLLGAGSLQALRTDDVLAPARPVRFMMTAPDSIAVAAVCCGQMMDVTPDGNTFVFQGVLARDSVSVNREHKLYARSLSDLIARPIAGTEKATSFSFSPDGLQLAFVVGQQLLRVALAGGPPTKVAELPGGYVGGTTWISSDRIVIAVGLGLYEANINSDSVRVVLPSGKTELQPSGPSYVAEGNGVLFSFASAESAPEAHWLPLGSTTPKHIVRGATPRYVPAWKKLVVLRGNQLLAFPFNPATGDTTGAGVRITDGIIARSPILVFAEYAVAANGTLMLARRPGDPSVGQITMVSGTSSTLLKLPEREQQVEHPRFSPNGDRIAMHTLGKSGETSIYLWDVARGVPTRLSALENVIQPEWTRGGDSVLFRDRKSGAFSIVAANGSGAPRVLPTPAGWAQTLDYAVHGAWLALEGRQSAGSVSADIVVFNRDSLGPVRPFATTGARETDPAISPDGKWLAYTSDETGRDEVYVSTFPNPTAKYRVTGSGGRLPVWSGDGRTIYVDGFDSGFTAYPFTPGASTMFGPSRVVYRRAFVRNWTISPDGTRILFIDSVQLLNLLRLEVVLNLRPGEH